jgi:hypothetical protein
MNTPAPHHPDLYVGDVVSVDKGLFTHVGVVLPGGILENRPGFYERLVSLAEFSGGLPLRVRRTGANPAVMMARAAKILRNPRQYDTVNQNCEHTVNEVLHGKAESPQLVGWALFGGIVGLVALIGR